MSDSKLVDRLTEVIFDSLKNGAHPTVSEVEHIPGGLTEISGTFNLSVVALACMAEIEAAIRSRIS